MKRSPHPFAATAVGLALFLDGDAGFSLADRLTRHFGVFREAEAGEEVVFDPIFPKDLPLPAAGGAPLTAVRRYRAAHDVGHFRFVECSRLVEGRPDGDVTPWHDVKFPFLPSLRGAPLDGTAVRRLAAAGARGGGGLLLHGRRGGGGDDPRSLRRLLDDVPPRSARPLMPLRPSRGSARRRPASVGRIGEAWLPPGA